MDFFITFPVMLCDVVQTCSDIVTLMLYHQSFGSNSLSGKKTTLDVYLLITPGII